MLALTMVLSAQETITLTFTSTTPIGEYYPFDVVNVTNVTRGWTESLMYPDITMSLTSLDGLQENIDNGGLLSEAYPNPFSGTANVSLEIQKAGEFNARIIGINGDVLSEYNGYIEEGSHLITINMSKPQMAFLVVKAVDNQLYKKILNVGYGTSDNILITKISDNIANAKTRSGGEFVIGDVMSYIAVSFYGGNMLESQRITQAQYTDETITLLFNVDPNPVPPTVTTSVVTNITHNSAVAGGNVTSDGGATVTERGVCYGTYQNPTISGLHTTDGNGTGEFTSSLTGLAENTTYYVRAYATNEVGTSYGSQKTFTTVQNVALPTITTSEVTNISTTSASCGGNVTSAGNGVISARGVCWSTSPNPTISNSHTNDGTGTGVFTSSMTGLIENTTYYVRAYATNEAGTNYGIQKTFTTSQNVTAPTVTTSSITNITQTTATCGGNVTSDGGSTVTARGFCWSTNHNPTTSGNHTTNGNGTGSFTTNLTGLTANTTYYVRAYATNSIGTSYGSEVSFTTDNYQPQVPTGAIDGLFTINSYGNQVYFSRGNLQYQASTNTWRFAENQWNYVGSANSNISSSNSGWIDLFGWGTSGYNHGAVSYQPWDTSYVMTNYYAYGGPNNNLYDQTGQADWGYNSITNGGNAENDGWRALTYNEWYYLFDLRSTVSGIRYAKAKVNNVNGIIILPDNWNASFYNLNSVNTINVSYTSNIINVSQWNVLENAGAVFLPAAGYRYGVNVDGINENGYYWSSTNYDPHSAYKVSVSDSYFNSHGYGERRNGNSVRLVFSAGN